jgi:N-acylneuraminate cytidylyltransferase
MKWLILVMYVNCIELLKAVGLKACPADACKKVKEIPGIKVMIHKEAMVA